MELWLLLWEKGIRNQALGLGVSMASGVAFLLGLDHAKKHINPCMPMSINIFVCIHLYLYLAKHEFILMSPGSVMFYNVI